jgi:hypothetical protein
MAFSKKRVNSERTVEENLSRAIRRWVSDGTLTCAAAFEVAEELKVPRLVVGQGADVLRIPLSRCQLGLFGYPGESKIWETGSYTEPVIPPHLVEAIQGTRDRSGRISCEALMAIADRFGVLRAVAGRAADRAGVRIKPCQLGAF